MDSEKMTDRLPNGTAEFPRKARIETQIHRRRVAKALSPLMLEWGQAKPAPPDQSADKE
jgi:hypothetical protein